MGPQWDLRASRGKSRALCLVGKGYYAKIEAVWYSEEHDSYFIHNSISNRNNHRTVGRQQADRIHVPREAQNLDCGDGESVQLACVKPHVGIIRRYSAGKQREEKR